MQYQSYLIIFHLTHLRSYSKQTTFIIRGLVFSTEFRTLYDLRLRTVLTRLFSDLFSPFSAVLVGNIHPIPFSGCRILISSWKKRFSCVYNASMCYLSDFSGSSSIFLLSWELVHSKLKTFTYIWVSFLTSSTLFEFSLVLHWWLRSLSTVWWCSISILFEGCFIFDAFCCWVITINNSNSWISLQIPAKSEWFCVLHCLFIGHLQDTRYR